MTNDYNAFVERVSEKLKNSGVHGYLFSNFSNEINTILLAAYQDRQEELQTAQSNSAQSFIEGKIPMGASAWKSHGEKYGYQEFFQHEHEVSLARMSNELAARQRAEDLEEILNFMNTDKVEYGDTPLHGKIESFIKKFSGFVLTPNEEEK